MATRGLNIAAWVFLLTVWPVLFTLVCGCGPTYGCDVNELPPAPALDPWSKLPLQSANPIDRLRGYWAAEHPREPLLPDCIAAMEHTGFHVGTRGAPGWQCDADWVAGCVYAWDSYTGLARVMVNAAEDGPDLRTHELAHVLILCQSGWLHGDHNHEDGVFTHIPVAW